MKVTLVLHPDYIRITSVLHRGYTGVTPGLHRGYTGVRPSYTQVIPELKLVRTGYVGQTQFTPRLRRYTPVTSGVQLNSAG